MKGTMLRRMKWLALLGAMAGCVSLDGLIAADAGSQDAGDDASEVEVDGADADAEADGEVAIDAGGAEVDGEVGPAENDASMDAAVPEGRDAGIGIIVDAALQEDAGAHQDAMLGPEPLACTANGECGADQICGPEARCMPRCTSYGACVVAQASREITGLVADGEAIYWSLTATLDPVGNLRRDGQLWRMVPGQAPALLSDQLSNGTIVNFRVHDGYVYFTRGDVIHRRIADASLPDERVQTFVGGVPYHWAVGDGFIAAISDQGTLLGSADGVRPMEPIAGVPAAGANVAALTAAGERLYIVEFIGATISIKSFAAADPASITVHASYVGDVIFGPVLGIYQRFLLHHDTAYSRVCSINLDDAFRQNVAGSGSGPATSFLAGDWIYWYQWENTTNGSVTRYSIQSIGTAQTLISRDAKSVSGSISITTLADQLYTVAEGSGEATSRFRLIYAMPLPPEPCAAELPCPTGKTCGVDALCH